MWHLCTGVLEPLAVLLVTPGTWATVEQEALQMLNNMAAAKAIKPDMADAPALVAALC